MFVFQEGGLQALNTLLKSEHDEVVAQACEAMSRLSGESMYHHDGFI